ncbi:MAG: hypothetical protein BRD48_07720 [Bacteroidetes bacterium QS_9_68_14]|nr:MAG: hypothetical protein BRD48_07720 [Bacteroidetes bacterium QS_9_68_14]
MDGRAGAGFPPPHRFRSAGFVRRGPACSARSGSFAFSLPRAMNALSHLLRTMAAVAPGQRVLVRGEETKEEGASGRVAEALARLGFEVHAAAWTDAAARRVHRAAEEGQEAGPPGEGETPPMYATAAPVGALPYPEAHFGWVVVQAPRPDEEAAAARQQEDLWALMAEARRHVRPGQWVFVLAPAPVAPEALAEAAEQAVLAEAEPPERGFISW